jgi:hypothetical protein
LLISERHQGHGYGRATIDAITDYLGPNPNAEVPLTRCRDGPGSPPTFYLHYGFVKSGIVKGTRISSASTCAKHHRQEGRRRNTRDGRRQLRPGHPGCSREPYQPGFGWVQTGPNQYGRVGCESGIAGAQFDSRFFVDDWPGESDGPMKPSCAGPPQGCRRNGPLV